VSPSRLADLAVRSTRPQGFVRRLLYTYVDLVQRPKARASPFDKVPPAELRFRVHGDLDLDGFFESGRQCSDDIQAALSAVAADIASFKRILDFGCGCGRTLQWLEHATAGADLHGTDIDPEAIAWCRRAIASAAFSSNGELPPLEYADGYFDFVYAISVFTHLSEELQLAWLEELRRVLAPGGLLLVTVRGASYASQLEPVESDELSTRGFVFSRMPPYFQQLFPSWYQTATLTEEYVRATWAAYFEVAAHLPRALDGCQDIFVLEKR
jgi:cyclopropane fatty-acyl-phospholipid synthase-like methyltransferase